MAENVAPISDSRLCPVCEYDLHGNTSGRCPECGTRIAATAVSRIPWIFQHARGGVRAYMQTVALLLFRPRRLASESRRRVPVGPALRFHQESLALATIIGAGMATLIFLLRNTHIEVLLNPTGEMFLHSLTQSHPAFYLPILVWTDHLYFLIPLVPSLFLSMQVSAWSYRQVFAKAPAREDRSLHAPRRSQRIAYYASGMAPVLLTLGGFAMLAWMLTGDEWIWALGSWRPVLDVVCGLLVLAAVLVVYRPTFVLLSEAGYRYWYINAALSILFLAVQGAMWITITGVVFWVSGYVLLAAWAMSH